MGEGDEGEYWKAGTSCQVSEAYSLVAVPTHYDSSVGMALAAMEALNNLNLFGNEVYGTGIYCVVYVGWECNI